MSKLKHTLLHALEWSISHLQMLWNEISESISAVFMGISAILLLGLVASSPIIILYIIFVIFYQK